MSMQSDAQEIEDEEFGIDDWDDDSKTQSSALFAREIEGANKYHLRAVQACGDALKFAIFSGKYLRRIKKSVGHGGWSEWVERNFKGSLRTAQAYMRLAKHRRRFKPDPTIAISDALNSLTVRGRKSPDKSQREPEEHEVRAALVSKLTSYLTGAMWDDWSTEELNKFNERCEWLGSGVNDQISEIMRRKRRLFRRKLKVLTEEEKAEDREEVKVAVRRGIATRKQSNPRWDNPNWKITDELIPEDFMKGALATETNE